MRDGVIDYNLDITVDGPVQAAFGSDRYADKLRTDGVPDARIRARDDLDGRPDWELVDVSPPVPESSAVLRGELMVSPRGDAPISGAIFWPLLGTSQGLRQGAQGSVEAATAPPGDAYGIVKDYNRSPPPIQVDWGRAKIAAVGEIVASRGAEGNWFVYSLAPLDGRAPGPADFETPFAFCDLAGIHDGDPDLAIRREYYPPHDPYFAGGRSPEASELVRYSWDQDHRHERWSYKLDLLGRHAAAAAQRFGDALVPTLPYDSLPAWIAGQRWDVAQFVAAEAGAWTSEGIAEEPVDMLRARDQYLTGLDSTPPALDAARVPAGYRAELAARLGDQPWLAISAVDHALHLARAETGIWRVDDHRLVRYASLKGRGIDTGSVEDGGRTAASLYALAGQLLLVDAAGVRVRSLPVPLVSFRSLPPSSHDTWVALGEKLRAGRPPFSGDDLAAMFDQFSDPVSALPGASLRDVRATPGGFQFVLDVAAQAASLRSGDTVPAGVCPVSPAFSDLAPDAYLVRYQEAEGYSVEHATPPALAVASILVSGAAATALSPVSLSATIRNTGHEAAHGVGITLVAGRAGGPDLVAGAATLDVPGDGTATARIAWTPPEGGTWSVRVATNGALLPGDPLRVSVAAAPAAHLGGLLGAQGVPALSVAAILVVAAILAGSILAAAWTARGRPSGLERVEDQAGV